MTDSDSESYDSLEGFITEEEENKFIKYCEVCYKSCTRLVGERFCSRCYKKRREVDKENCSIFKNVLIQDILVIIRNYL